ncbi:MAG: Asp-tRNA(Asn)/Glu-tRNA(Gln) amidotransferase subunit GatA [Deltaproteobacteria bacterium]|nr:Asp-tRNA(Asn)/Glu-tRNA(Gln) amidotransferase subunit GatA [Deltaproteobacteria bacterium]
MDLRTRSIPELAADVRSGRLDALALCEAALERIERCDEAYGAWLHVASDAARDAARIVDERRARGDELGPLAGIPIAIKDVLCTVDQPTTAASRILVRHGEPWRPPYDATAVRRLRDAGALLLGKANCDEFAMGSSNEHSAFKLARNPWDLSRTPGGSSGGSAVAVAAAMVPGALGTDTGGSVRQPASFTGTVGVKPTYGRVSRHGLIAFASSLDQVGPLTADVQSAAALLEVIAGHDPNDATSSTRPVPALVAACERSVRGLRVGVPKEYFAKGLEPEVEASVRAALTALERDGVELVPMALPHTRHAIATYYVIASAECSSNLARFDGVRFGARAEGERELARMTSITRGRGFGAEVKRRILLGTFVLSSGYAEAYYQRAQRVRRAIADDFHRAFRDVHAIAAPVSPTVAFPLGSRLDDPLAMYLADIYTLPSSLAGVPALSVPCGLAEGSRMPVGLQLIGPPFDEAGLFALARAVERQTPTMRAEVA